MAPHFRLISTGCSRQKGVIDDLIAKPRKDPSCPGTLIQAVRGWVATLRHKRPVVVDQGDGEDEPLLTEKPVLMPRRVAMSPFSMTTTSRRMRRFNNQTVSV